MPIDPSDFDCMFRTNLLELAAEDVADLARKFRIRRPKVLLTLEKTSFYHDCEEAIYLSLRQCGDFEDYYDTLIHEFSHHLHHVRQMKLYHKHIDSPAWDAVLRPSDEGDRADY